MSKETKDFVIYKKMNGDEYRGENNITCVLPLTLSYIQVWNINDKHSVKILNRFSGFIAIELNKF